MAVVEASGENFLSGGDAVRDGSEAGQRPFALHIDRGEGGVRDNHEVHLVCEGRRSIDGQSYNLQVVFRRREVLERLTGAGSAFFYGRR